MPQRVRALALLLIFASVSAASTEEINLAALSFPQAKVVEAESPPPLGSPFEWFIVGSCLCVSFCAGGYTLITYLRQRDALSTLARIESQSRHFSASSGFDSGPD